MVTDQMWQSVAKPAEGEATCFELKATVRLTDGSCIEVNEQGFLIRYQGQYRAWRNRCPHAGAPLDWIPGQFFSEDGRQLVCHVHFAHFDPLRGSCLSGPCPHGLMALPMKERDGMIQVPCSVDGGTGEEDDGLRG